MPLKIRQFCFLIHRYSGLAIAVFLFLAGITGALLAFHEELDDVFNHKLAYIEIENTSIMPVDLLHDRVQQAYPEYKFSSLPIKVDDNKSAVFVVDRQRSGADSADKKNKAPFQEVFVNPYSGEIIGTRDKKQWVWRSTMDKVFWLHRDLLLGEIGKLILGITALLWTINCFIGFYLTLPRAVKKKNKKATIKKAKKELKNNQKVNVSLKSYMALLTKKTKINNKTRKKRASLFRRWLPAWKIRRKTNFFKLNYDLHQAFGLWLWIMMFVIAWSSVGFNLKQVYRPVMEVVVRLEPKKKSSESKPEPAVKINKAEQISNGESITVSDKLQPNTALKVSKENSIAYLTKQAELVSAKQGLKVKQRFGLRWVDESKQWQMRFKTNKDIGKKGGVSSITVDAITGQVTDTKFGHQMPLGSKINQWLMSLHMGHISQGLPHLLYQVLLVLIGLAVSVLSFSGVYLWWKNRSTRKRKARRDKVFSK